MRVLVIDNYGSFTFNLVQMLGGLGAQIEVVRNDGRVAPRLELRPPAAVIISPGPGRPEQAGCCVGVVQRFSGRLAILGVCLGHQAVGVAFGASVCAAPSLVHGKVSRIRHDGSALFAGIPSEFVATRYHSLVVDGGSIGRTELRVAAHSRDGCVMAVRHATHPTFGVQFHPESVLTRLGMRLVANFLEIAAAA